MRKTRTKRWANKACWNKISRLRFGSSAKSLGILGFSRELIKVSPKVTIFFDFRAWQKFFSEKRRERERRIMSQSASIVWVCVYQEKRALSLAIFSEHDFENGKIGVFLRLLRVVLRFLGMAVCFFPQWKLEGYKWKQQKSTSGAEARKKKTPQQQKKLFSRLRLTFVPDSLVLCAFCGGDLWCNYQLLPINANLQPLAWLKEFGLRIY